MKILKQLLIIGMYIFILYGFRYVDGLIVDIFKILATLAGLVFTFLNWYKH